MTRDEQFEEDMQILAEICDRYGWSIAVPHTEDDEEVPGMVIGTDEYIESVLGDEDGNEV